MRNNKLQAAIQRAGSVTLDGARIRGKLIRMLREYPDIETNLRVDFRGCVVPSRGWTLDEALADFIRRATQHDYRRHRHRQMFARRGA